LYEEEGHLFLNNGNVLHSEMIRVEFVVEELETY